MKLEGTIRHGMDINVGNAGSWTMSVAFGPVVVSGGGGVQSDWNESDATSMAYIKNKPNIPTIPATATQNEINAGTSTSQRTFTPQLMHDNAYIVEEAYSSGSLKANKFYDFGEVTTALVLPDLDVTNDLVSNVMNFWALHFKVGELTPVGTTELSITFPQNPSGIIVDDEPAIKEGDYVEIMITKHTVGSDTNYYASIKVWQAQ